MVKNTKAALDNRLSIDNNTNKEYASILQRNVDNRAIWSARAFCL